MFLQFFFDNNRFLNQFPKQLCNLIKYLCTLMKYEYGKIIVPMKANLNILEELNASESLKKEDATTIKFGKKSQKSRKILHTYCFMNKLKFSSLKN